MQNSPPKRAWTAADLQQLLLVVGNINANLNSMPEGTRLLLESHGFGRYRLQMFKRATYQLKKALIAVTGSN